MHDIIAVTETTWGRLERYASLQRQHGEDWGDTPAYRDNMGKTGEIRQLTETTWGRLERYASLQIQHEE